MFVRVLQWPLAYWRGEIPLAISLLGPLLALRIALFWAGGVPFLWVDLTVILWQITGAWRATKAAQDDQPDPVAFVVACSTIVLCLLLFLWPQLDRWSAANLKPETASASGTSKVRLIATAVALDGEIDFQMYDALEQAIAANPELRTVNLNSEGGRVFAARGIARLIAENGLATHVDLMCASACTLAFMAGHTRTLTTGGRLGFHGYRLLSPVKTFDATAEEEADKAWLLDAGLSPAFVTRIFTVANDDMWFPDRATLMGAGVLTP